MNYGIRMDVVHIDLQLPLFLENVKNSEFRFRK